MSDMNPIERALIYLEAEEKVSLNIQAARKILRDALQFQPPAKRAPDICPDCADLECLGTARPELCANRRDAKPGPRGDGPKTFEEWWAIPTPGDRVMLERDKPLYLMAWNAALLASSQGQGDAASPRQPKGDGDRGWTIAFSYLKQIDKAIDDLRNQSPALISFDDWPSLESIEAVLLAIETIPKPHPHPDGLREALEDIAKQHIGEEIDFEDPDYEEGYVAIVEIARAALAQADQEAQG